MAAPGHAELISWRMQTGKNTELLHFNTRWHRITKRLSNFKQQFAIGVRYKLAIQLDCIMLKSIKLDYQQESRKSPCLKHDR